MPFTKTLLHIAVMLLFAFALCPHVAAQDQATGQADSHIAHVYILSGQSNMAGSGQAKELAADWQQPIDNALIFKKGGFVPVEAGTTGRFGPEIGFAHYLANNHPQKPKVYLIKFALSGQPLDAGWTKPTADGGGWVGPEPGPNRTTFYPGTGPDDPNIGLHYKRLYSHVSAALQQLRDDGLTPTLRGIVWMQGEADAKHEVSAGRYDKTLALFKQRIEEDFADGNDVPLVFGQVLPHEPAMKRFTSRDLIRQRMAEADWRSDSKRAVPNIWMVPTENMELLKDTVHYSTKGLLTMGQAFGVEMLKAHRKAELDAAKEDE
jgi:hypothetical protein